MPDFYHVDRVTGRLKPGQIIKCIFAKSDIKDRTNRAEIYTAMFPNGVTYHGWNYLLNDKREGPDQDLLGMIEVLAEFIRRSYYPEKISRFQSFFACKTIRDAERFISLYPVKTPEGDIYRGDIWLVRCDKVSFEGDMTFLGLGDCWLDAIINLHLYWTGKIGENPLIEVLLKPPITIVEKVKSLHKP